MTFTATAEPVIVIPEGPVTNVQLEAGSFATSYIPNNATSGTVTRSPDLASIPVSAFGYNQDAGTWLAAYNTFDLAHAETKYVFSSGASARIIYQNTGSDDVLSFDGATQTVYTLSVSYSDDPKVAAYAENGAGSSAAFEGVLGTGNASADALSNHDGTFDFGSLNGGAFFLNGHIKSVQYFPRRLTDAQLQTLTS